MKTLHSKYHVQEYTVAGQTKYNSYKGDRHIGTYDTYQEAINNCKNDQDGFWSGLITMTFLMFAVVYFIAKFLGVVLTLPWVLAIFIIIFLSALSSCLK